jgi:hypothetical protein
MPTKQGDIGLLKDPVAQRMLQSTGPARFAYNWTDGTPRVVPIWFHWNGEEIVLSSPEDAPKFKSLQEGDAVAVTIDNDTMPYKVLLMRGTVHLDVVEGLPPEYEAAAVRVLGEAGGQGFLAQLRPICPRWSRAFIKPTWVGVMDFESRFPNAIERAMEQAGAH